jgi:hypothetical protein
MTNFGPLTGRLESLLRTTGVRLLFAAVCLAAHLGAAAAMGRQRFGMPFNAAPGSAPGFVQDSDVDVRDWNRLLVSRWDSAHYIALALRGFSQCPAGTLSGAKDLNAILPRCRLHFYPGYAVAGRIASLGGRVPIDYSLFGVSLAASFAFLFLWTGPSLTRRLGVFPTYLAAVLFNAFTTGFALVTLQTEPLILATTLGAFVALDRRVYWLGALLAGAASGVRISGIATSLAYAVALVVITWQRRPPDCRGWARRGGELVLSGWGVTAICSYFWVRFGDPLLYIHAHSQAYGHDASPPRYDANLLLRAIDNPLHEGLILVPAFLFLLLGMRDAMMRFEAPARAFWYTLTLVAMGGSMLGSYALGFAGMNRYLLCVLPLFFAMATVMLRRPLVIPFWLAFSVWHYWNVDLCFYTAGPGDRSLELCNCKHWVGRL